MNHSQETKAFRNPNLIPIEKRAILLAWSKGVSARHVEFPQPDGKLVWAIEYRIPLRFEDIKGIYTNIVKDLAEKSKIKVSEDELQMGIDQNQGETFFRSEDGTNIPKNITAIRIVDLSPQEALPISIRNLKGKRNFWHDTYNLIKLTRQEKDISQMTSLESLENNDLMKERNEALNDLLADTFYGNNEQKDEFLKVTTAAQTKEILFIHSHGGYDNIIGEDADRVKGKDAEFQTPGNRIDLQKVIEKYDDPNKYACILINACYMGTSNDLESKLKVFRLRGFSGKGSPSRDPFALLRRRNVTLVSEGN